MGFTETQNVRCLQDWIHLHCKNECLDMVEIGLALFLEADSQKNTLHDLFVVVSFVLQLLHSLLHD